MSRFRKVEIDTSDEKNMVVGAITSTSFLRKILSTYDPALLQMATTKIVMEWVIEYFTKYDKAPGKDIQEIYNEKSVKLSEEEKEWIGNFLDQRSREFKSNAVTNEQYLFDRTMSFFERQFLHKASKLVTELVEEGKLDEARDIWIQQIKKSTFDSFRGSIFDSETLDFVYNNPIPRKQFNLNGMPELRKLLGPLMSDWFILFMGPMGRGKTSLLTEFASRAMLEGLNVMFYSLESGKEDVIKRVYRNLFALTRGESGEVDYYEFIDKEDDTFPVDVKETIKRPGVESRVVVEKALATLRKKINVGGGSFGDIRVQVYPSFSAGYEDIVQDLEMRQIQHGFLPHMIIVDYAGIMAPVRGYTGRDVYDYNSKMLKRLAEERKVIMISAIQGSRKSLEAANIRQTDVPEDIRQLAHADIMLGINQRLNEKEERKIRLSVLKHRWRDFNPRRQVVILQQPDAAQFYFDDASYYVKSAKQKKEEERKREDQNEN